MEWALTAETEVSDRVRWTRYKRYVRLDQIWIVVGETASGTEGGFGGSDRRDVVGLPWTQSRPWRRRVSGGTEDGGCPSFGFRRGSGCPRTYWSVPGRGPGDGSDVGEWTLRQGGLEG